MITRNKIVLGIDTKLLHEVKYEAIESVSNIRDLESCWARNKTPMVDTQSKMYGIFKDVYRSIFFEVPSHCFAQRGDFPTFCHNLGIEPGEYMSQKKYDTTKEECFLCEIIANKNTEEFNERCHRNDMVMYESANFIVKIEYGCLIPGMVMICPKKHIMSAAAIEDEEMEEYKTVMKDVEFLLHGIYGFEKSVIFFEHGSAPDGFSSHQRSIVHAHVHVAVGIAFTQRYIDMVSLKPTKLENLKGKKYMSYQVGTSGDFLAVSDPNVYVQRQYPRQVIAELVGIPNEKSNWRVEPFICNMEDTFKSWYKFLTENSFALNDRIINNTKCFVVGYPKNTVMW